MGHRGQAQLLRQWGATQGGCAVEGPKGHCDGRGGVWDSGEEATELTGICIGSHPNSTTY